MQDNLKETRLQKFGRMIQAARNKKGLTRENVSDMISSSVQALDSWEQGRKKPMKKYLLPLLEVLEIEYNDEVKYLLGIGEVGRPSFVSFLEDNIDREIKVRKELATFPLILLELRLGKNLEYIDVANEIGVPRKTYIDFENGVKYPSIKQLLYLCDFYGVTLNDLFFGKFN